ncbi:MAG: hypothetical protein V8T48_03790 [Oscillospiraceae bacterium]
MSLWDNVKKFAQPYADDDYDDYGEDDDYLDDYEEPEKPAPARRKPRRAPAPTPAPEEEEDEEADDYGFGPMTSTASAAPAAGFSGQVLNMNTGNKQEVVLFRPGQLQRYLQGRR